MRSRLAPLTELIDCYLQIERERFEERLEFALNIPDTLAQCAVPSLIVQPLVENAVKHGIARARHGGTVSVTARLDEGRVIVVRNTGAPFVEQSRPITGSVSTTSSDGCSTTTAAAPA